MPSLTDWMARNFFISEEDEQTSAEVAAAQRRILERQRAEGKVDTLEYLDLSEQIDDTGANFYDRELGQRGVTGLVVAIPLWVWFAVAAAAAFYFWPLLRPIVGRLTKRL